MSYIFEGQRFDSAPTKATIRDIAWALTMLDDSPLEIAHDLRNGDVREGGWSHIKQVLIDHPNDIDGDHQAIIVLEGGQRFRITVTEIHETA
jgi:hypothetical protein